MKRITAKHRHAARALAAGASQSESARAAGVAPNTVGRWLKDPDFSKLVDQMAEDLPENPEPADLELPADWREQASREVSLAALHGARTIRSAARGESVPKASIDAAKWALDKAGIDVQQAEDIDEPSLAEVMADIPDWVLEQEAAKRHGTH